MVQARLRQPAFWQCRFSSAKPKKRQHKHLMDLCFVALSFWMVRSRCYARHIHTKHGNVKLSDKRNKLLFNLLFFFFPPKTSPLPHRP